MPGFARENEFGLLSPAIEPKTWLGNRVTVATHFDMSYNVACVVAGRRRFTLIRLTSSRTCMWGRSNSRSRVRR